MNDIETNVSEIYAQDQFQSEPHHVPSHADRARLNIIVKAVITIIVAALIFCAAGLSVGVQQTHSRMLNDNLAARTISYQGKQYVRNDNLITFLVLGFDGRNKNGMDGQVDVFMLAVVDTVTGKSKVITIPRDSMVKSPYYAGDVMLQSDMNMPLCLTYAFAGGDTTGLRASMNAVSRILGGISIPFYYMINYKGMPDINDAIGGVPLTPIQSIPDTPITEGKPIVIKGQLAERYVRWRDHETLQSPMDRQKREMHYANAFMAQAKHQIIHNPLVIRNVLDAAARWSTTNANVADLAYYGLTAVRGNLTDLQVETLPGDLVRVGEYAQFHLNEDGVRKVVVDTFYRPVE